MTNVHEDLVLSGFELVVLARLSSDKPPEPADLAKAVHKLALPAEPLARARRVVADTLAALQQRGLVAEVVAAPRRRGRTAAPPATPRRHARVTGRQAALTEDGSRALRAAFDLERTPTWSQVRDAHLAARGLGLPPGSAEASATLRDAETISIAVLRAHFRVPEARTIDDVCDALIMEALGIAAGPFDLKRIRAHVLARCLGVEAKGEPVQLARRVAAATLGARRTDKRSMVPELGRRWIYKIIASQPILPLQPTLPLQPAPSGAAAPEPPPRPPALAADALLTAVREAIPRIGSDGRFGPEKVFVSAIWHRIECDSRLLDLSLDRFKRWLVTANRDRLLDLARADLVGAMDAELVAESEIEDLGATFHFVLDHRAGAPGSEDRIHAR